MILSLFIVLFNYNFPISFDPDITPERQAIIQFIGNYIGYGNETNNISGFYFIYISWMIVGLIPILIYRDAKKSWSMNITTFFFPNFFFYVFLSRYSPIYYEAYFPVLLSQTIILGVMVIAYSILLSLLLKRLLESKTIIPKDDILSIAQYNRGKCLYCGAEFDSRPQFCYKCSKEISISQATEVKK